MKIDPSNAFVLLSSWAYLLPANFFSLLPSKQNSFSYSLKNAQLNIVVTGLAKPTPFFFSYLNALDKTLHPGCWLTVARVLQLGCMLNSKCKLMIFRSSRKIHGDGIVIRRESWIYDLLGII